MAAVTRVVDTSAWIEWLTGSPLGKKLPDKPHCIVPTIVQLEVSTWLVRELGEEQADQVIAYTQKCLQGPARHSAHFAGGAPDSVPQQPH